MISPRRDFVKPQYGKRCFSDIPQTVQYLLTGRGSPGLAADLLEGLPNRYDTVILFFIDAFGWRFFERYRERYPFLQRFVQNGRVLQLTSQFPSTTAAHATAIHTGLPVGQSGVFEWQYYEPGLDRIITPLLFSFAGTKERDTLKRAGVEPVDIYPAGTFYRALRDGGVDATIFQHGEFTPSTFSTFVFDGTRTSPFTTLPEALVNLRAALTAGPAPVYCFLYYGSIDALGHQYGPASPQLEAEIDAVLTIMERWFARDVAGQIHNALFMLTADHGLVEVDPQTTVYLNRDPRFAGIERFLRTSRQGDLLVPAGSPRDMFLYVRDGMLAEARAFLAERLDGVADVVEVVELIADGYFGLPPLADSFRSHVGNLVILPYAGESVWWYEKERFEQKFYGHHGGLTHQEMDIPLLLLRL